MGAGADWRLIMKAEATKRFGPHSERMLEPAETAPCTNILEPKVNCRQRGPWEPDKIQCETKLLSLRSAHKFARAVYDAHCARRCRARDSLMLLHRTKAI